MQPRGSSLARLVRVQVGVGVPWLVLLCSVYATTALLIVFLRLPDPEPYERTGEGPAVYGVAPPPF